MRYGNIQLLFRTTIIWRPTDRILLDVLQELLMNLTAYTLKVVTPLMWLR